MTWEKGKSGNPTGSSDRQRWGRMLSRVIQVDEETLPEEKRRLRLAAEQLFDKASKGDMMALKELGDRLDGKPAQSLEIGGHSDNRIVVELSKNDAKVL